MAEKIPERQVLSLDITIDKFAVECLGLNKYILHTVKMALDRFDNHEKIMPCSFVINLLEPNHAHNKPILDHD